MQIIFVLSALLPPFGQWPYGESCVQKNTEFDPCAKNIFVLSELFVFKGAISAERCVVIECRYINI